jgi:hypothetical protein
MSPRKALWAVIGISTAFRLAWAASLGVGNDEAYHALFVVHPDWSYFDHPPMLAVVEAIGFVLGGGGMSALAMRIGFILLFAGSTLLMARLTSRFSGERAGTLAAFVLNATAYYGFAASTFLLPDGPLLFFWLLTLDRLAAALETPGRLRNWAWVGLAWGGALLSKYHAILLPVGALLYLAVEPRARSVLRRPGPYLAVALGLLCFSPVLAWNAVHGWASFAFQGGRAFGALTFRFDALGGAIAGQAIYLLPWTWAFLVATLVRALCRLGGGKADAADLYFLCQAAPPLVFFLGVACLRPVLPHWSLVGLLPIVPLLGRDWAAKWASHPVPMRRRAVWVGFLPVAFASLFALHSRTGLFQQGRPGGLGLISVSRDPSVDVYGWDRLARELERRGLTGSKESFLFTSRWYHSGQLAFALHNEVPVLCYNRHHAQNFAYWSRPGRWVGHDGIFVGINDCSAELTYYARFFTRVEPLGKFTIDRGGVPVRTVHLYRGLSQVEPFPFGNTKGATRSRSAALPVVKKRRQAVQVSAPSAVESRVRR